MLVNISCVLSSSEATLVGGKGLNQLFCPKLCVVTSGAKRLCCKEVVNNLKLMVQAIEEVMTMFAAHVNKNLKCVNTLEFYAITRGNHA